MRVKLKSRLRREINRAAEMKKWGHHEDDDLPEAIEPRPNGGYVDEPVNLALNPTVIGGYSIQSTMNYNPKDFHLNIEQWDGRNAGAWEDGDADAG